MLSQVGFSVGFADRIFNYIKYYAIYSEVQFYCFHLRLKKEWVRGVLSSYLETRGDTLTKCEITPSSSPVSPWAVANTIL